MNTLIDTLRYFVLITIELIVLFVFIGALVEIILMYVPEEKIRRRLSGAGVFGNIVAAGFGALTPFCACSTIPMTVGFLNAGVPFGSTMSFLIASPLLNPIILGMLGAMVGIKAMVAYFVIAFLCSILFGFLLEKIGAQKYVKNVRLKPASCCAGSHEVVDKHSLPFPSKLKVAFAGAWDSLRPIMGYLLVGVALGAGIYGYVPQDFVMKIAGPDNPFAIPVAAVLGILLYIRAETAIPIGLALMGKGMSIGAVISLIIGGAGMAIPEMTMLASIFKKQLVAMIVLVIFLTAVVSGYLFNILL
ncbi:MAG TPA: permease [Candidatus Alistipes merdipullorum]|nr:permease [Candidatus Alistipes merdipullorum]